MATETENLHFVTIRQLQKPAIGYCYIRVYNAWLGAWGSGLGLMAAALVLLASAGSDGGRHGT